MLRFCAHTVRSPPHSGGYPLITFFTTPKLSFLGGFNLGGTNETGQVPDIPGNWGLIDKDTPVELHQKQDYRTGKTWQLVFSDEFNVEGRSFYPGDDPYWEAVDLHYWATGNLEWYDPSMIMTRNGSLEIQLRKKPNHDLDYMGGMISTWNKFCFTGGLVEAAVMLPGSNNIHGLWPAVWAMGNLGRAGYGASLDGMVRDYRLQERALTNGRQHSGRTHTTRATSERWLTRRTWGSRLLQRSTTTNTTTERSRINQAKGCPAAHVRESHIQDPYTPRPESTSAGPRPRSISLRLR